MSVSEVCLKPVERHPEKGRKGGGLEWRKLYQRVNRAHGSQNWLLLDIPLDELAPLYPSLTMTVPAAMTTLIIGCGVDDAFKVIEEIPTHHIYTAHFCR